ncbi:sulfite exporter TauE/SafE family protein [Ponticoccus sp. SC2-23]|uniref:sulfite exporter TauE/SafE family protein n=1 Tax=Alexandriicola marinus TaxID=2081710 RepID=UPI000FDC57CB|nr:sulfite exporter TauE/SafE family protein [Alexandriicola marinus]MBM1218704.1 sulfite exporter TauE/SafE family protein [Ponticoccus sp. SC6-9]MBM1224224.1 sulfite exporter TauE/SafE family protein [Ponticoccus sp. SC6-15]MBM1229997.1 sulfite exporter TauE/SafE family protein [Ponticoccus sp. SC6-38]MBM1233190.1 sulfite exporter TauE/SafE family protein [Ponticoccus sp. SC6-45]MBM1236860.1 sulfite exporter TauE/SafE family protein [Ponticoccus sp. SC6-49]MBM1242201.1 sulfite exporter TauE
MELLSDPLTLLTLIAGLALAGASIGVLAGLFGVGGGAISVPVFFEIFGMLGYPAEVAMPLAVGTSLAVIIPTSISSARGHHRKGTLEKDVLRAWAVPILAGVIVGAVVARYAPPVVFQAVFVAVALLNSVKLLTGGKGWSLGDSLPGRAGMSAGGALIGLASAIMGIGGGALSNLFLTLHGMPIHRAVGTSAGVGVLIAIPGTIGYILAGYGQADLPPGSLGFVSLVAFALTIPTSMLTTRFGVALAHRMTRRSLEIAFGSFLLLVAIRFIWAIFG